MTPDDDRGADTPEGSDEEDSRWNPEEGWAVRTPGSTPSGGTVPPPESPGPAIEQSNEADASMPPPEDDVDPRALPPEDGTSVVPGGGEPSERWGPDWSVKTLGGEVDDAGGAVGLMGEPVPKEASGCLRRLGIPIAVVGGVIAVVIGIALAGSDSGDEDTESKGGGDTAASADADDLPAEATSAAFAGSWVLASGLDDPTGIDVHSVQAGAYTITLGPSSAEIVIEPDGSISGGHYRTSFVGAGQDCTNEFTADYGTASGQVQTAEGMGTVKWAGTKSSSGCPTPDGYPSDQTLQFWITGDTMVLCRSNMASPTTCADPAPRVVATFERRV